jgi:hypothetical protein
MSMRRGVGPTVFALLFFSLSHNAGSQEPPPAKAEFIFGNGIWTTEGDASDAAKKLEAAFKERHYPLLTDAAFGTAFNFDYARNHTACVDDPPDPLRDPNCLIDLLESLQQAAQESSLPFSYSHFWRFVLGLTVGPPDLFEIFSGVLQAKALTFNPQAITFEDLRNQVTHYRETIDGGTKVILVAHSQGNFFGNQAYTFLSPTQRASFGMVSVATPAGSVAGNGPYTTLVPDFIHLFPGARPANLLAITPCGNPISCHFFLETYLRYPGPRNKILDDMLEVLTSLEEHSQQPVTPDTLIVLDTFYNRLLIVDPETGATRFLMSVSHDSLSGLAYDRVSRLLYSVDIPTNELIEFDLKARTEHSVGVVGVRSIIDMTFGPNNKLFGMGCGEFSACRLVEINTATGAGTPRESVLFAQPFTLVYDPDSEKMYTTRGGLFGSLLEIDPATGSEQFVNFGPQGVVYMADKPGSTQIYAIGRQPLSNYINMVGTFDPAAPFFVPFVRIGRSLSGIEMISLSGVSVPENQPPVLSFIAPDEDDFRRASPYPLTWIDEDPDSSASIDLFYSADSSCSDPHLIAANIPENDTSDVYVWDTSALPAGEYHVLAVLSDGVNPPVNVCSRRSVIVFH